MSTIFVNAGQCGNQLGYSILDSLYAHLSCPGINLSEDDREEEMNSFFRLSNTKNNRRFARVVCLDTEPKVVNECLGRANEHKQYWNYDHRSVAYRHGGAGNNWAMGYDMCKGEFMDTSLDCVRRELEHCDQPATLVITHSVAGGTGSGLGTRLTEAIEDEFPETVRVNFAITPYHFGEVVVQHYNTVLCLSKISVASQGVLVFENEVAQHLCKQMKGIERPSLQDINSLIAANVVPILLPKYNTSLNYSSSGLSSRVSEKTKSYLSDDIIHLCSHPGYRFIDVKTTPQTSNKSIDFTYDSWSSVLNTLEKMQIRGTSSERGLSRGIKYIFTLFSLFICILY
jgi:tubulin delta